MRQDHSTVLVHLLVHTYLPCPIRRMDHSLTRRFCGNALNDLEKTLERKLPVSDRHRDVTEDQVP